MIGPLSDKAGKESTMDYPVLVRPGKPSWGMMANVNAKQCFEKTSPNQKERRKRRFAAGFAP